MANIYHRIQGFSTRNKLCHFLQSVVINRNKSFVMLTTRYKFYDVGRYAPERSHVKFHLLAVCGFFFWFFFWFMLTTQFTLLRLSIVKKSLHFIRFSWLILVESEINIIVLYHKNCILYLFICFKDWNQKVPFDLFNYYIT